MINLGDRVKDKLTEYTGIVVGVTDWIAGCRRIGVKSQALKDGAPMEAEWFDEPQLDVIEPDAVVLNATKSQPKTTGGPTPRPKRERDPIY